jgi:hypothetical protein
VIEHATNIRFEYPVHTLSGDAHTQRVQRLVSTASGRKPLGKVPKIYLVDVVEDVDHR